jgi:hypothetical protein
LCLYSPIVFTIKLFDQISIKLAYRVNGGKAGRRQPWRLQASYYQYTATPPQIHATSIAFPAWLLGHDPSKSQSGMSVSADEDTGHGDMDHGG